MSLLPADASPRLRFLKTLSERTCRTLDAIVVLAPSATDKRPPDSGAASRFAALPEADRWRDLAARGGVDPARAVLSALGNSNQTLMVLAVADDDATPFQMQAAAARALRLATNRNLRSIAVVALHADDDAAGRARDALLTAALATAYRGPAFHRRPKRHTTITTIAVVGPKRNAPFLTAAARANNLTRWLTALPPNELDTRAYRRLLMQLAKRERLRSRWYSEAALRRLGAGAFLAVSAGNERRDAGIMHLQYRPPGAAARPAVALVGKGILFDTGGNNLKPHRNMLDMHQDMSGSAVALAVLLALKELQTPVTVDCWLAITENRIGPTAYRPQDVVCAMNGVSIQVIH
ncbi:MAG TPA: hypothetical protein P5528_13960, partial [Steroidobacteraceae bacterium]|nr:hypothetical protein [Steroidobacteraceae bacterium]